MAHALIFPFPISSLGSSSTIAVTSRLRLEKAQPCPNFSGSPLGASETVEEKKPETFSDSSAVAFARPALPDESFRRSRANSVCWNASIFQTVEPVALARVRAGTSPKSGPSPSAMVGCVKTASRSIV